VVDIGANTKCLSTQHLDFDLVPELGQSGLDLIDKRWTFGVRIRDVKARDIARLSSLGGVTEVFIAFTALSTLRRRRREKSSKALRVDLSPVALGFGTNF
jgi:hypothetical protein